MTTATALQPNLHVHDSKSTPPPLFDGTTRLYICYTCPFAQRVWITKNYKGLDNIQLVPINLRDKPSWYLEKVYPPGKVPSLEHNGKVIGESLDLLEYLEQNFDGPNIFPNDPAKLETVKELLKFADTFMKAVFNVFKRPELTKDVINQELGPALDYLESTLGKYAGEGPFFVGQVSAADFACAPFLERYSLLLSNWAEYDITEGRARLANWFKAVNELEAYKTTKSDPEILIQYYKEKLGK